MSTMTGMEKAALVIMQMSHERAAQVMRQFSETEAEELAAEIIRLRKVDEGHAETAITEFHAKTRANRDVARGGRDAAATLLEASFGQERGAGLLDRATSAVGGRSFEFLDQVEPAQLSHILEGEMPETVALVLAHLSPDAASVVLSRFDALTRVDIAQAIAGLNPPSSDIIEIVAETLKARVRSVVAPTDNATVRGGVQPLVDIIFRSDLATEYALLEELERRDPALAEEVRSRMLNFDDIIKLEDRDIQQVIRGIDSAALAIALHEADEKLVERVRANMSERNRELLNDEISTLGRVRPQQITEARSHLVRSMRELSASGAITLDRDATPGSVEEHEAADVA